MQNLEAKPQKLEGSVEETGYFSRRVTPFAILMDYQWMIICNEKSRSQIETKAGHQRGRMFIETFSRCKDSAMYNSLCKKEKFSNLKAVSSY